MFNQTIQQGMHKTGDNIFTGYMCWKSVVLMFKVRTGMSTPPNKIKNQPEINELNSNPLFNA